MGVYADRGLHYMVVLKNGKSITVLGSRDTDERLVVSDYYLQRKESWFTEAYRGGGSRPVAVPHPVAMTPDELTRLEGVLAAHGDDVASHGWYDVTSLFRTG